MTVLQSVMSVQHSSSAKCVDVVYVCTGQRMLIDFHTVEGSSLTEIHRCQRSVYCEDAIDVTSDAGLSFCEQ
jgi:hypothetical protein